eukprot:COSAG02_NODE_41267_length_396_cov_0.922559_1_plen_64_part_01
MACAADRMPRKKGQKKGVGKHATGQRKVAGASLRAVEQRAAPPPAAPAAAAPPPDPISQNISRY